MLACALLSAGCSVLPRIAHEPSLHNPFPQLSKVAVAPFFNLSNEPTVDGRRVAMAYFNELQLVPGFEVVPVGVVEGAIRDHNLRLTGPEDARRLAQLLEVDAVVIGAVTDYTPYYPPRMTLQVEWYAANPCFHAIPPGYGLPWGTRDEADVPAPLVFEAEMALAKAQMKTQTPDYEPEPSPMPQQPPAAPPTAAEPPPEWNTRDSKVSPMAHQVAAGPSAPSEPGAQTEAVAEAVAGGYPPGWPDPRGFIPPGPRPYPPACRPTDEPVLKHTRAFNGNDSNFTQALQSYYFFRDEARFGGWQSYLQRSEDFIRFCCHAHIAEMLTARGGAGETRLVLRWPTIR